MTQRNLDALLAAHAAWIASGMEAGERADLSGESLEDVDLTERDLRWALLANTRWTRAVLRGARLAGADLKGAVLRGADLRDADLVRADLRGADLRDADLRGAKLVHRVGFNELDLPRDVHAANLTGALLEGARVAREALVGTGAIGPHEHACDGVDPFALPAPARSEPVAGAPSWSPVPVVHAPQKRPAQPTFAHRGHGHDTLLAVARFLAAALPELDGVLAAGAHAPWTYGLGEGLDAYEACALPGPNGSLSIFVYIARCDTSAGPVEMSRSTTFTLELARAQVSLGWSGTGTLVFRAGERALVERLVDAGVPIAREPLVA